MGNGNLARATLVLSIVLGATTIAGGTAALIFREQSSKGEKKAESVEAKFDNFHKSEYEPFKEDFTFLKGQILNELKNLGDSQQKMNDLLQKHMEQGNR